MLCKSGRLYDSVLRRVIRLTFDPVLTQMWTNNYLHHIRKAEQMIPTNTRIKLLLLILLAFATIGLTRATAEEACGPESCAAVLENGRQVGFGCVAEGSVRRQCTATLSGCVYDACPSVAD